MKNLSFGLLLAMATIASALGQAPSSIAGYTLRVSGVIDPHTSEYNYSSIDLLSNSTYVIRVSSEIEVADTHVYSPPVPNDTYTYQQISATEGIVSLSRGGDFDLTFSSPNAGTIPGPAGPQIFSISPTGGVSSARALVNMSILISAKAGAPVTLGFIVGGTDPCREILIRAVGPSLAQFGITNFAPYPTYLLQGAALDIFRHVSATGTIWSANPSVNTFVMAEDQRAGAFPLLQGSNDEADVYVLRPGAYTITVNPTDPTQEGTELIEVYEVE